MLRITVVRLSQEDIIPHHQGHHHQLQLWLLQKIMWITTFQATQYLQMPHSHIQPICTSKHQDHPCTVTRLFEEASHWILPSQIYMLVSGEVLVRILVITFVTFHTWMGSMDPVIDLQATSQVLTIKWLPLHLIITQPLSLCLVLKYERTCINILKVPRVCLMWNKFYMLIYW